MAFDTGNKLASGGAREGSGRKPNFVRARLDTLMRQAVTDEDLLNFLESVKARANAGNEWAVEFFFDRIFGKPGTETERTIIGLVERLAADSEAEDANSPDGTGDEANDPDGSPDADGDSADSATTAGE